jgi:hypothetical protein
MGDYWINPQSTGFDICKKVFIEKSNALFPGKCKLTLTTLEETKLYLTPMALHYEEYMKTQPDTMETYLLHA